MLYEFHKSFDGKSIKWRQIEHAIHSFQILKENKLLFVNINAVDVCTYTNIGYDLKIKKKNKVKQKKSALKSSMSKSMVLAYAVWLKPPPLSLHSRGPWYAGWFKPPPSHPPYSLHSQGLWHLKRRGGVVLIWLMYL